MRLQRVVTPLTRHAHVHVCTHLLAYPNACMFICAPMPARPSLCVLVIDRCFLFLVCIARFFFFSFCAVKQPITVLGAFVSTGINGIVIALCTMWAIEATSGSTYSMVGFALPTHIRMHACTLYDRACCLHIYPHTCMSPSRGRRC